MPPEIIAPSIFINVDSYCSKLEVNSPTVTIIGVGNVPAVLDSTCDISVKFSCNKPLYSDNSVPVTFTLILAPRGNE